MGNIRGASSNRQLGACSSSCPDKRSGANTSSESGCSSAKQWVMTGCPFFRCTKLPMHQRRNKTLPHAFEVVALRPVPDDTLVVVRAGNEQQRFAKLKNFTSRMKGNVATFNDFRLISTSGRGKTFNLSVSIMTTPPQIFSYENAIKVTVDGPRDSRKNIKHAESFQMCSKRMRPNDDMLTAYGLPLLPQNSGGLASMVARPSMYPPNLTFPHLSPLNLAGFPPRAPQPTHPQAPPHLSALTHPAAAVLHLQQLLNDPRLRIPAPAGCSAGGCFPSPPNVAARLHRLPTPADPGFLARLALASLASPSVAGGPMAGLMPPLPVSTVGSLPTGWANAPAALHAQMRLLLASMPHEVLRADSLHQGPTTGGGIVDSMLLHRVRVSKSADPSQPNGADQQPPSTTSRKRPHSDVEGALAKITAVLSQMPVVDEPCYSAKRDVDNEGETSTSVAPVDLSAHAGQSSSSTMTTMPSSCKLTLPQVKTTTKFGVDDLLSGGQDNVSHSVSS